MYIFSFRNSGMGPDEAQKLMEQSKQELMTLNEKREKEREKLEEALHKRLSALKKDQLEKKVLIINQRTNWYMYTVIVPFEQPKCIDSRVIADTWSLTEYNTFALPNAVA